MVYKLLPPYTYARMAISQVLYILAFMLGVDIYQVELPPVSEPDAISIVLSFKNKFPLTVKSPVIVPPERGRYSAVPPPLIVPVTVKSPVMLVLHY